MTNFTEEIKNEIMTGGEEGESRLIAFLSAFIRTSGSVVSKNGSFGFEIVTENERTAEYVCDVLENSFSLALTVADAKFDAFSGRDKLTFACVGERASDLLKKLAILRGRGDGVSLTFGIDESLFPDDECRAAFIRGAFLGGGSCTLPDEQTLSRTGYHFEVVFSNKMTANDFSELLCDFEVLAKSVSRKESSVVYVKSKEVISDLLHIMGTEKCLEKLNKIVEMKDKTNNDNRVSNCSVSNIDKTVTASVAQIKAIETIAQTIGLKSLPKTLFDVAEMRLADPNASMRELADRLNVTKSCLNHRMRKISEMANQLS